MAGEGFEYDSHFWQDNAIIKNEKDLPSDIFYIQIRYREILLRSNLHPQERLEQPFVEEPMSPLMVRSFWVSKTSMLRDDHGYGAGAAVLYEVLASLGIPRYFITLTIDEVSSYAAAKITEPRNIGREVLPIVVAIEASKTESMDEGTIAHPGISKFDMPATKRRRILV